MATTLKQVKQGENIPREVRVSGESVIRKHVTEHRKLGKVFLTWTFNFEGVSKEDILVLASRAVLIGARPTFKETSIEDAEGWKDRTFSVADYLKHNREKVTTEEKARRALGALTPEQRAALLRELTAEVEA